MANKKHIAIFASHSGTNAEAIMKYFKDHRKVEVGLVISNNISAGVVERASKYNVEYYIANKHKLLETEEVDEVLATHQIDFIVLAGFMLLFPERLVKKYKSRIINIHPALLPKYGGKGMYGKYVHEAVLANRDKESGITIHWVNEEYDEGKIIFQAKCPVKANDTADDLAARIHELEHYHYPRVVEDLVGKLE